MPLLFVNLLLWHVVSRVLVIFIFVSHVDPMVPSTDEIEVGFFLVFNGVAFLVLLTVVCAPSAFGKHIPILHRSSAMIGLLFGLLSCAHDILVGSELMHGNDYVFSHLLYPMSESYPIFYQAIPLIFFLASMLLVVGGAITLTLGKTRRTSRGGQHHERDESKALFWFVDLP